MALKIMGATMAKTNKITMMEDTIFLFFLLLKLNISLFTSLLFFRTVR